MWRYLLALPLLAVLLGAAPPVPGPKAAVKEPKKGWFGVQIAKEMDDIVVRIVFNGSPAHDADIRPGDVLVRIHGAKPADLQTAVRVIGALKPGQKVKVVVRRDGRERELEVKVGAL